MAKQKRVVQLRELALIGARARLQELRDEERRLREVFPELFRGPRANPDTAGDKPVRRRRRMSAAQRKAVSERMRKYWAERRKKGN
ncbi:MAG TPA: hypothetical protein VNK41_05525 [Vicinamibacterales bacterium]|nr:hypothetical protein [Vicinamibacterales bacterium]